MSIELIIVIIWLGASVLSIAAVLNSLNANKKFSKGHLKGFVHWLTISILLIAIHALSHIFHDIMLYFVQSPQPTIFYLFDLLASLAFFFGVITFIKAVYVLVKMANIYGFGDK